MDKRIRLGLICLYDKSWLGGMNYIQNLIKALNTLDDIIKPIIDVHCLSDEAYKDIFKVTQYPYLEKYVVKKIWWRRLLAKLLGMISHNLYSKICVIKLNSMDDVFFPWCTGFKTNKLIMWRPDFQEKHLPLYFTRKEIKRRDYEIIDTCRRQIPIVFSSNDSKNDFVEFFPEFQASKTFVIHFAADLSVNFLDLNKLLYHYQYNYHFQNLNFLLFLILF